MGEGRRSPEESRRASRRLFAAMDFAYATFALASAGVLATIFARATGPDLAAARTRAVLGALLVFLFFAATIINLGITWAARIMAARRYSRDNILPSCVVVALGQAACLAAYACVVTFVAYYRVAAGGQRSAVIPAVVAVLAGLYFLRLPGFIHRALYAPPGGKGNAGGGGEA